MSSIEIVKLKDNSFKIYHVPNGKYLGKASLDVDGMYYYWPCEKLSGSWSSYSLREIADRLDELNKEYEESVKEYFRGNSK
jgi:hypothetical protein